MHAAAIRYADGDIRRVDGAHMRDMHVVIIGRDYHSSICHRERHIDGNSVY